MREEIVEQQVELRGRELAVLLPPHGLLGALVADHKLVLGRAAGVHAGLGAERAAVHDRALTVGHRMLVQRRLGEIPMDGREAFEAKFIGAMGAVSQSCLVHE